MNSGNFFKFLFGLIVIALFLLAVGWVFWRALKRSDDPARLIFKWILTVGVVIFMVRVVVPAMSKGGFEAAFFGVPLAAAGGLTLAIIWRHSITGIIANPFGSIYDGGDEKYEATAFYSVAEKFRQRNQFSEAVAEIRKQLQKFPNDYRGQMLLAEINAENLQDLQSAEIIIEKIIHQPGHAPAQIAGALHALADWHLKLAQDPEFARVDLEKIIQRFPDSQFAQTASQRIAHLGSVDSLLAGHERPTLALKHFDPYRKLATEDAERDSETEARLCLAKLEQHPLDTEAREKLAMIYANDYHRLDLAEEQLEQLIAQPTQRNRQVARWLNLLAELQMKLANDISGAEKTIRRIQELFPNTAYAEQASARLAYLPLEAKRNQQTQSIKLTLHDKDLGLKKSPT
jgi:outer membrane protein assembly factor BamD (BamD/ComL family)